MYRFRATIEVNPNLCTRLALSLRNAPPLGKPLLNPGWQKIPRYASQASGVAVMTATLVQTSVREGVAGLAG
jgi:hypothetical protein